MKFSLAALAMATLAYAVPTPEADAERAAAVIDWANGPVTSDIEARQTVPASNCTTKGVHFILVRGHGGKVTINGQSVDDPNKYNVLASTRDLLLAQVPGSDVIALPYDYNNPDQVSGTNTGGPLLKNYIMNYAASCPNSKIATLGYSQGALVVMDALCGASEFPVFPTFPMDSRYAKNVIAAMTYGDESRVPNQSWNYGTCKGTGLFPRTNNYGCAPFAASLRSYCDQEDNFCCMGGNNTAQAHAAYVKVYNQAAVNFIKQRITATGGTL